MKKIIRRSTLILPVNNSHFVEKVYLRGADAFMLDREERRTQALGRLGNFLRTNFLDTQLPFLYIYPTYKRVLINSTSPFILHG